MLSYHHKIVRVGSCQMIKSGGQLSIQPVKFSFINFH